ncbi:MAG: hypothetical protein L3J39_06440 [Verrucomicrobiales bacterium]|nr:hypothetical protein [Verrucomicrobiales bacterium]
MKTTFDPLPPLREDQLDEDAKKAVRAAQRAGKKLRERKRLLGHKLVISKNGKVLTVDP